MHTTHAALLSFWVFSLANGHHQLTSLTFSQGSFPVGLVNAPQLTYLILNENQLS